MRQRTTTQSDINRQVMNIIVGFAPLKPAEFVVVKIQQIAGSSRPNGGRDGSVQRQHESLRPLQELQFRVKWDGRYVAGVSKSPVSSARPRLSSTARAAIPRAAASRRAGPSAKP
jgi:hypothetical protein